MTDAERARFEAERAEAGEAGAGNGAETGSGAEPTGHSPFSREGIWGAPAAVRRLLEEGPARVEAAAATLARAERVFLVGTGSSYHVACYAEALLRSVGTESWAVTAFEFARYPRTLRGGDAVVVFSHRGTKRYSLESARHAIAAGLRPIVVTGEGGAVPGDLDAEVLRTVPQERSSMHTVSVLGGLTLAALLAARVGELDGLVSLSTPLREGLPRVPDALEDMLDRSAWVQLVARETESDGGRYFFAGAGPNRATAVEDALKAREGAYVTAEGFEIEGFIHGPLVGVEPNDLVTVVAPPGESLGRAEELLRALKEIGCATWLQGAPTDAPATYHDVLPNLPEALSPFPTLLLGQLFAYHLAGVRGTNADSFRLDHPAYKAALDTLTL